MSTQSLATKALHAGHDTTTNGNTRAVPIYQSSSYVFKDANHAANLFNLSEEGFIYTRINNPTNDILEKRLADIEGGNRNKFADIVKSWRSYCSFKFVIRRHLQFT